MIIYIILIIFSGSICFSRKEYQKIYSSLLIILLIILIGLRHKIGGDWDAYISIHNEIINREWYDFFTDPLYHIINKISHNINLGIYGTNIICGAIGITTTYFVINKNKNYSLAIFICITYFFTIVGMGYTRQFTASGLIFYAALMSHEKKYKFSLLSIFLAYGFHSSSIILAPIILFKYIINFRNLVFSSILSIIIIIIFNEKFLLFYTVYLDNETELKSMGTLYRTFIHLLAGFSFLLLNRQIEFIPKVFFGHYFLISIISFVLALFIPNSTFIDRFLIYFLPAQAIILANLHESKFFTREIKPLVKFIVMVFFSLLFFYWLNFSQYKDSWTPYKTILF